RAHGLRPADGAERADHVATECEFLRFLSFKEAYAELSGESSRAAECREAAASFLREHLGRFAEAFCGRLLREKPPAPYAAAAELLLRLVRFEARSLGVPLGDAALRLRTFSLEDEAGCMSCRSRGGTGGAWEGLEEAELPASFDPFAAL